MKSNYDYIKRGLAMIKFILKRCMKYKITFILINVLLVIVYASELIIPYIFSDFIDSIIQFSSMESVSEAIFIIAALTLVLMVSSYFYHILSELLITKASQMFFIII